MSRLTLADIEAEIASKFFFTANDGVIGSRPGFEEPGQLPEIPEGFSRVTFCVVTLHNGHREVGVNYGPVDPSEFSGVEAQRYAYEDAIAKLWNPLGFRLRDRLASLPALTLADAEADVAGVARPDSPGLNTKAVAMEKAASARELKPSTWTATGTAVAAGALAAHVSIGRFVHYVLNDEDAAKINGRRTSGSSIQERILEDKWSIGAQAHIGNKVAAGDVLPALVVRTLPSEQANLQVFLDGNDVYWATTRAQAAPGRLEPGRWQWPARV